MRFFSKRNFWFFVFRRSPLFAAFVRRWGGEKKGEGEKHSPDSQEPTFTFLVAAKGRARSSVVKQEVVRIFAPYASLLQGHRILANLNKESSIFH